MTTEALVPAAAEPGAVTGGGVEIVLPQVIVDAGPSAVARFLEFFAGRIVRAGGGAVPRVVRSPGSPAGRRLPAPRGHLHPDSPWIGPDGEAALGGDPHARRLARRQPGPPGQSRRGRARPEARRHEGRDAGPLAGGGEEALRDDRHGRPGRAPGPGAALRHALQLCAGERGVGDAAAGLLRAGEPRVVQAPREGRAAARRPGPPPVGGGPRRLRRGGRTRGAEGDALPERGAGGAPADRTGAAAAPRPGDDQAAGGRGGAAPFDVLPHVPGDGDHGVSVERGDAGARETGGGGRPARFCQGTNARSG